MFPCSTCIQLSVKVFEIRKLGFEDFKNMRIILKQQKYD